MNTNKSDNPGDAKPVRYGVDCARFGDDVGTLYRHWGNEVRRVATFAQQRTGDYLRAIRDDCRAVAAAGATSVHVRVDGGLVPNVELSATAIRARGSDWIVAHERALHIEHPAEWHDDVAPVEDNRLWWLAEWQKALA